MLGHGGVRHVLNQIHPDSSSSAATRPLSISTGSGAPMSTRWYADSDARSATGPSGPPTTSVIGSPRMGPIASSCSVVAPVARWNTRAVPVLSTAITS